MKKCNEEGVTFVVSYATIENMSAEYEAIVQIAKLLRDYNLSWTHSINFNNLGGHSRIFIISKLPQQDTLKKQRELIEEIRNRIMLIRQEQFLKGVQNEAALTINNFIESVLLENKSSLEDQPDELFMKQQQKIVKIVEELITPKKELI